MVKLTYWIKSATEGEREHKHFLPSDVAHRGAEAAKRAGALHHVLQGCWDPQKRAHVDDEGRPLTEETLTKKGDQI